jgi:hypothetical protein
MLALPPGCGNGLLAIRARGTVEGGQMSHQAIFVGVLTLFVAILWAMAIFLKADPSGMVLFGD